MRVLSVIFLLSTLSLSTSCNIEKRIEKQQERFDRIGRRWLEKNPCANDSTIIYVPGKRDSIPIVIPTIIRDTVGLKQYIDSIGAQLRKKYNEQEKDCNKQIKDAYNIGYENAEVVWKDKVSKIKVPLPVIDTIKITLKDKQYINLLQADITKLKAQLSEAQLKGAEKKGKLDKWFLLFVIACMLLSASLYFNIKKK